MCGRARCTLRPEDLPRACGINDPSIPTVDVDRYHPYYNVSPGAYLPVLCNQDGSGHSTVVHCMKWGLIPSFTKKTEKPDHFRMFNARSESIFEKPSFRRLLPNNRCLVAVEGFYEWKKDGSKKQPYYIHFEDHRPLVLAALYDSWVNSEGEVLYTFTIMTTCCSSALQWLHDRMPVILGSKSSVDVWLNNSSSSKYDSILKPYGESDLVWHPVTPEMGKPSFNGPECIKEIQLKSEDKNQITKFFTKIKTETQSDLEPEVKCSPEGSASGDTYEDFKVELDTDEKEVSIISKGGENDVKSEAPSVSSVIDRDEKCGIKRVHEEFLTDFGSATEEPPVQRSARKKGNYKNAEDKQPTLLSFFGKR